MSKKALIVEDEGNIAELLQLYLEKDGFSVRIAEDGRAGLEVAREMEPDILLLDIMLPRMDGVQVLKRLRDEGNRVPTIMLTAKGETYDKVYALEAGADDYVTKPFVPKEVVARVHAVLRRYEIPVSAMHSPSRIANFDNLMVNLDAYELIVNGKKIDTPPKELELLYHLASAPNRVFTRNQLLDEVWGFDYFGDSRTVDVHIKRLREKLEGVSERWTLKTVWGVGYKFEIVGNGED
ncbi:MAG: response regulator transcription factor [Oscillospiraceae bacterium]|jgi:DNA-binding response OmpR family regulator|nr:response regulator transcription factor [Oscillospiraceae bacterium]